MTDDSRSALLPYSLDERLLTELAQGLEDPITILQRYEYTEDEAKDLAANYYVVKQVEAIRADMEKTGNMDILRDIQNGRMLTEHMMVRALAGKVKDEHILKFIELIDRRKERRAQAEREAQGGGAAAFQVVITLPGANQTLNVGVSASNMVPVNLPVYAKNLPSDVEDIIDIVAEESEE